MVESSTAMCCERAILRFSAHFDAGEAGDMEALFATDGVWKRQDGDIIGVAGLRAFMARRSPGIFVRHVITNMRTTAIDDDHAVVDSYVTVYRCDFIASPTLPAPLRGPDLVGRYRDVLVREAGDWKLMLRETRIDFKQTTEDHRQ